MKAAIVLCFSIGMCAAADSNGPQTSRVTDANGARWILRQTPFGVAATREANAGIRAADAGESVRFVKSTPFGPLQWERRKADLNPEEREIWEQQRDRDSVK